MFMEIWVFTEFSKVKKYDCGQPRQIDQLQRRTLSKNKSSDLTDLDKPLKTELKSYLLTGEYKCNQ